MNGVVRHEATGRKRKRGGFPRKIITTIEPDEDVSKEPDTKLQNGHMGSAVTERDKEENIAAVCNLCNASQNNLLNLSANVDMKHTLLTYWKVPSNSLESTLACICIQCVYKINAHMDVTRSFQIRLHRLTNGQISKAVSRIEDYNDKSSNNDTNMNCVDTLQIKTSPRRKFRKEEFKKTPIKSTITNHESINVLKTIEITRTVDSIEEPSLLRMSSPPSQSKETADKNEQTTTSNNTLDKSITPPLYSPHRLASYSPPLTITESYDVEPKRAPYMVRVEEITPVRYSTKIATNKHNKERESILSPSLPHPSVATTVNLTSALSTSITNKTISSRSNSQCHNGGSDGGGYSNNNGFNCSMLEIFSERPESALITESGGTINNYLKRIPQQRVCGNCSRVYWRKNYFKRHVKRCAVRRRHKSMTVKSCVSNIYNGEVDIAINLNRVAGKESNRPQRIYRCSKCLLTLENLKKLRDHKKTHFDQFNCAICGNEFTTRYSYDFHRIICEAQKEAHDSIVQSSEAVSLERAHSMSARSMATNIFTGCITRARSRAISRVRTYKDDSTATENSNYDESYINNDDDEDDAVSVADTMYSKRMLFTGNWIEDHGNNYASSMSDVHLSDYYDDLQIGSYKEYDLYLLNRLKEEIVLQKFTCYAPHCNYSTDTLLKIMVHDYLNHFKSSWFYCRKCSKVFTSKVFLDYHLDRQNYGSFRCFKCDAIFNFQHQLDIHIICHTKCINYRCNYCKLEFLTENDLLYHCEVKQHDPNGEFKYIRIESELGERNVVPSDENYSNYVVKIIEMRLKELPTKRPMVLPGHKPYRRLIGDIQFENQDNPNCSR